ncbi:ankyrin repeat domain-containing protein 27 isoform X3 [Hydra vulgaris]|uniref:Ankyrin repeat domain-containing protein 27 isoform X3 n=1 Tax=Hydra vulgaris TaxID=6087 RepID=A0ABM4BEZ8_HYDVU
MGDSYDEDLLVNPFYKSLITKGKTIFENASSNRYTICIPRKGTITSSDHSIDQFQNHILKPINETIYQTLNNKHAKINGSFIITTKGFGCVKSVEILFEETFFNKNKESYHVLCIDQPFEGGNLITLPVFKRLESLKSCYEFLWPGHLKNKRSKAKVNQIITLFNESYTRLESESMRHSMDAANTVFTRAMQICLKKSYLRKPASSNRAFMENVKLAVETYVMDGLYKRIFKGISVIMADEDAAFNKITRNLSELQVKDLGIKPILCKNIPKVKNKLSDLIRLTTPLEKLCTLKIMITTLSGSSNSVIDKSDLITADDLLPALVFVIIKSDVPNWLANLSYMKNFHFSQSKNDEFQFYLSSVEAAIEHIRSGQLDNVVSMTQAQRLIVVDSLFQRMDSADKYAPISPVDNFFELIRAGNLSAVLNLINDNTKTMQEIRELMCHPLCSCDSCEKMTLNLRRDPAAVTVFSRDALGCTALHQAAEFGCVDILYELIKKGAIINATNYHGSTPLHYACQRGHHKAAVILSHYGADINAADNEGNTPLHLAVSHGHEVCAEYLCSQECESRSKSKPNLDAVNENQETPLHIASRWGFSNLVYLLVKNGASLTILNKENQTPKDCTLNTKILDLFSQATSLPISSEIGKEEPSVNVLQSSNKQNSKELIESKISPLKFSLNQAFFPSNSSKQSVEFSQLLKAVADGNSVLVREKLGLINESCNLEDPDNDFVDESLCHPLCQCNNCLTVQKKLVSTTTVLNASMTNAEGITLLHVAAFCGHDVIVKLLLREAEANPNVFIISNKWTPLHLACQYNNIECVNLLLKKGAKTNVKDINGNTPLHFCCTNGYIESAILLLQKGADVRIINKRGNTPLHNACRWNYADLVQLLLHYGAPVNIYNKLHILPINYSEDKAIHTAINEVTLKQNTKNIEHSNKAKMLKKVLDIEGLNTNPITNNNHTNKLLSEKDNTCTCSSNSSTKQNKSSCTLHSEWHAANKIETLQNASNSIEAWFNSLETENVKKLKLMSHEIINFDKQQNLRHVSTSEKKYSNFMKNGSLTNVALESDIHQSYSRSNEHNKVLIDGSINNELNYEGPLQNLNLSNHAVESVKALENNLAMYHISLKDDATNEKNENLLIQTNQSNNTNQPME